MATLGEQYLKELESALRTAQEKLRSDLGIIRGNRPSIEMISNIKVNYYEQMLTIKQLGSLSSVPPRSIRVGVWDKNAVGPVMKSITDAKMGLSTSNDGNNIIATLSPLGAERREELMKLVKKTSEAARIKIRTKRDETIKKIKEAEAGKTMSEDESFRTKEKVQKSVDEANKQVENITENKLKELGE